MDTKNSKRRISLRGMLVVVAVFAIIMVIFRCEIRHFFQFGFQPTIKVVTTYDQFDKIFSSHQDSVYILYFDWTGDNALVQELSSNTKWKCQPPINQIQVVVLDLTGGKDSQHIYERLVQYSTNNDPIPNIHQTYKSAGVVIWKFGSRIEWARDIRSIDKFEKTTKRLQ